MTNKEVIRLGSLVAFVRDSGYAKNWNNSELTGAELTTIKNNAHKKTIEAFIHEVRTMLSDNKKIKLFEDTVSAQRYVFPESYK
jgi:hypothetical protein